MVVTIYPGADRNDVLRTLREMESAVHTAASHHSGSHGSPAYSRLTSYLEWAANAAQMLEHRVSMEDVERLVLTRGYERLVSAAGSLTGADIGTQRVLNGLVDNEIRQRADALQDAVKALAEQIRRWPEDISYAVADTSIYIEHDSKLRHLDFAPLLDGWPDKPVVVIVPLVVLDELDGLKQRGGDSMRKWRASYTLSVLDDILSRHGTRGLLREAAADGTRGAVRMDVLLDPPRHERLPINDDEIIDRAVAAQGLAGTSVTLLTFDTSQAARARQTGLTVKKLTKPLTDEPADTRIKKPRRQPPNGSVGQPQDDRQQK